MSKYTLVFGFCGLIKYVEKHISATQDAVILFSYCFHEFFMVPPVLLLISEPMLYFYGRQDIIQLEHEIVLNGAIIEEREQGIIEIQQQIGELNEMFKDLALLVHEQGTMLG